MNPIILSPFISNSRHVFAAAIAAIYLFFSPQLALAQTTPAIASQPYVWKSVTVGAGGFVPGIVFSTKQPGLAYCRTDIGSAYRWDDQLKQWMPLTDWCGVSNYFGAESIAPDPVDANRVYLAAGMYRNGPAAIMRSNDQGRTWTITQVPFTMGGNEDGRGVGERLAVDPNDNNILYFGSRHDGLWTSGDAGATWTKVAGFPASAQSGTGAGLSFVLFDRSSGSSGSASTTIFVGSTDSGASHLFRSGDAGRTWDAVAGQPSADLLPCHAQLDSSGDLFISYGNAVGPNGVTSGAVWKFSTRSEQWTDITPDKSPSRPRGGYGGLGLDAQHPGTLAVATMNRWSPGDTVWRSTDAGVTWKDIRQLSTRDAAATPYLDWGERQPRLGWWIAALAIDPFDSNHVCYGTGATVWASGDFTKLDENQPTHWSPWVKGIEETAILSVVSPTGGSAHLFSAFGDICGFTHDNLDVSPPQGMFSNPIFNNTLAIDCASGSPNIVVRTGTARNNGATMAYSEDGGHSWRPLTAPLAIDSTAAAPPGRGGGYFGSAATLILSADGKTLLFQQGANIQTTNDVGRSWKAAKALPASARIVADQVNPAVWYAISGGEMFVSRDGAGSFAQVETEGLPASNRGGRGGGGIRLLASLAMEGDLWLSGGAGLYHSSDGGRTFARLANAPRITAMGFGKAPPGKTYPAIFVAGTLNNLNAIWRSDDAGESWIRINDDQHQYGTRFRCISGDPRIYGRVYVGTDGRGILYADIAPAR